MYISEQGPRKKNPKLSAEKQKEEDENQKKEYQLVLKIQDMITYIIGSYLSKSSASKYEILEYFSTAENFHKKQMRKSYVQEILY